MKKLNLKWLKSFFTFDLPVNYNDLTLRFRQAHEKQHGYISSWPTEATYRYLISDFWGNALKHYLAMLAAGIFITIALNQFNTLSASILALTGFLVYVPLYFMIYRPYL
ncbi:hypothetical protein [Chitinophaga barathri]|uniref:Uncharacterized protein n=1 Tax=Chitinophaga barathri TaxID=1647451 RepID=A0A3N4MH82_9BACT|nr:hypothetical protein [Chitinophaga barathri]RPD39450.1 hypothetical protein EG028_20225 [Chitinophaga barathri]